VGHLWSLFLLLFPAFILVVLISGCGAVTTNSSTGPSASQLTTSSSALDFGSTTVGSASTRTETVTVSGGSVTITQLTVTGSGFSISGPSLPLAIGLGQSTTITLTFNSQSAGSFSGNLNIVSNATNSPTSISLTAVAAVPPTAFLALNPTSLDFGSVAMGSTSPRSVVISNTGSASMTVSQLNVTGAGYSASGLGLPLTLAAGASGSFIVNFTPSATGTANGNLSLASTASNSPTNLALTGNGAAAPVPQLSLNPTSANFGNVTIGTSGTLSIVISNTGNANLIISQITTSGTGFSLNGVSVPLTLTPGQSSTYTAQFAPASVGSASGQISFASNAASNPILPLTGSGVAAPTPQLSVSPASAGFGNVTVGSSATKTISISNTGNANLTISQITTSGSGFSGSGVTLPLTLSAGQSANYTAKFTPAATGSASGQISFASNASTNPTVSLTGTGVAPLVTLNVTPTTLSFNNTLVGSTNSLSGTLTATGGTVTVSSATVTGNGYSISGVTFPLALLSGQSSTFTVSFTPAVAGSAPGNITFASNASNSPAVSLSGAGTLPHSVDLSWTASTSASVAGYNVYRGTQTGGPYLLINSSLLSGTAFTDNTVQAGNTYFYVTTAIDTNSSESTFSNEVQAVIPTP